MRPLGRLTAGLLALLALALLAVAGCGGDDGGPDRSEGLTPDRLLAMSIEAAGAATSYRVAFEGEISATPRPGQSLPGGAGNLLRSPLPLSGEGQITAGAASVDVSVTLSGIRVQPNLTKVGDGLYLSFLGQDFQIETPAGAVEAVDPLLAVPSLLDWMAEPTEAGREEVDGEPTVRLTGRIDPEAVVADLADLAGGAAPSAEDLAEARTQARAALKEDTIEVWVGTEDLLPRRIRVDLRLEGEVDAVPQLAAASLDMTLDLSDYGAEVRITAPDAARPLSLDDLGGLTP